MRSECLALLRASLKKCLHANVCMLVFCSLLERSLSLCFFVTSLELVTVKSFLLSHFGQALCHHFRIVGVGFKMSS